MIAKTFGDPGTFIGALFFVVMSDTQTRLHSLMIGSIVSYGTVLVMLY